MNPQIVIPVFVNTLPRLSDDTDSIIGEPSTAFDRAAEIAGEALAHLSIDGVSLRQCLEAARFILLLAEQQQEKLPHLKTDSLGFELGISATGKVAFLGNGVNVQTAAKISITLKVV